MFRLDNGPSRCEVQGTAFLNEGYVAREACCACGGGFTVDRNPSMVPQVADTGNPTLLSTTMPTIAQPLTSDLPPTSTIVAGQISDEVSAVNGIHNYISKLAVTGVIVSFAIMLGFESII